MLKNILFQKSQNWVRGENRKPWYCKSFQTGVCFHNKDHENGGKLYRHICAYCLRNGKQLPHGEKDCTFAKKQPKMSWGLPCSKKQRGQQCK